MNGLEYVTGDQASPKTKPSSIQPTLGGAKNVIPVAFPITPDNSTNLVTNNNNNHDNASVSATTTTTTTTTSVPASGSDSGSPSVSAAAAVTPKEDVATTTATAAITTSNTASNESKVSLTSDSNNTVSTPPTKAVTPEPVAASPVPVTSTIISAAVVEAEEDSAVKNTRLLREASELFANWKEEINKTFIPAYNQEPVPQDTNPKHWSQYISIGLRHFRGVSAYFRDPENFQLKERCVMNLGITDAFGNIEQYRKLLELLDDTFIIHLFNVGPKFIEGLERQLPDGKNARMKDVLEFLDKKKPLVVVETVIERRLISFWMNLESKLGSPFEILKFFAREETYWAKFKSDLESREEEVIDEFLNKVLPFQFKVVFRSLKGVHNIPVQKQYCKILAEEYNTWKKNKEDYRVIKYKAISSRISVPANTQPIGNQPLELFSQPQQSPYVLASSYIPSNTYIRPQDSKPSSGSKTDKPASIVAPQPKAPLPPVPSVAPQPRADAAVAPHRSTPSNSAPVQPRSVPVAPAAPVPKAPRNSGFTASKTTSDVPPVRSSTPVAKKQKLDSYRPSFSGSNYASRAASGESGSRGNDYNDVRSHERTNDARSHERTNDVRSNERSKDVRPDRSNDIRSNNRSNDSRSNDRPKDVRSNDRSSDVRGNDRSNNVRSNDSRSNDSRSNDTRSNDNTRSNGTRSNDNIRSNDSRSNDNNRSNDSRSNNNARSNGAKPRSDNQSDIRPNNSNRSRPEEPRGDHFQSKANTSFGKPAPRTQASSTDNRSNVSRKRGFEEVEKDVSLPVPSHPKSNIHPDRLKQVPQQRQAPQQKQPPTEPARSAADFIQLAMSKSSNGTNDKVDPNTIAVSNTRVLGNGSGQRRNSIYNPPPSRRNSTTDRNNNSHSNNRPSFDKKNYDQDMEEDDTYYSDDSYAESTTSSIQRSNVSFNGGNKRDNTGSNGRDDSRSNGSSRGGRRRGGKGRRGGGGGSTSNSGGGKGGRGGRGGSSSRGGGSSGSSRGGGSSGGRRSSEGRPTLHQLLRSGGRLPNE
ncbi:hypothetical protein JA1_001206 [Spathaspora sp. JA1]|nr:hypothetical protein JA1_001206 [Spathaspora sp. JA1]